MTELNHSPHLFHEVLVDVSTEDTESAESLSRKLPDLLLQALSRIESSLDDRFPQDTVTRYDTVEIDLGKIHPSALEEILCQKLTRAFADLKQQSATDRTRPKPSNSNLYPIDSSSEASSPLIKAKRSDTGFSSEASRISTFLHYLKHGTLPWWAVSSAFTSPENWQTFTEITTWPQNDQDKLLPLLHELLQQNPISVKRLSNLIDLGSFVESLLTPNLNSEHSSADFPIPPETRTVQLFLSWLISPASSGFENKNIIPETPLTRIAFEAFPTIVRAQFSLQAVETSEPHLPSPLTASSHHSDSLSVPIPKEKNIPRHQSRRPEESNSIEHPISSPEAAAKGSPLSPIPQKSPTSDFSPEAFTHADSPLQPEHDGIVVENAGLVLLNPFLTPLFRNFHWLDSQNKLVQPWHAAQALQYLCSKKTGLPEPTLALEKILCGQFLEYPAELPKLSDEIFQECEHLLSTAIKHWSVLKNTSPDGIRESFLIRPGLIFIEEKAIHLRVEQRSYDLLLNQLPWALTPIKLPWMKKPLHVHWLDQS